ncbi:MAG: rhodanese-like domain-containing protein [Actinomycetota bacterium]
MQRDPAQAIAEARKRLKRLTPEEAKVAVEEGAVLIDTRSEMERAYYGSVPGAIGIPFNMLDARADPASPAHDPALSDTGREVVVICAHGNASSIAAARLQDLGFAKATDVVGGFEAWKNASLPVEKAGAPMTFRRPGGE